jgi:rRNA-processing protein FCF1
LVEVICDTNFLIHLATRRIKNIDNLDMEIGSISFVVPEVVSNELIKLQEIPEKNQEITMTLNFIKKFKIISINGTYADQELINHVKNNRSIIGTMDKVLKNKIKKLGSSIVSIHNDKIVLES